MAPNGWDKVGSLPFATRNLGDLLFLISGNLGVFHFIWQVRFIIPENFMSHWS